MRASAPRLLTFSALLIVFGLTNVPASRPVFAQKPIPLPGQPKGEAGDPKVPVKTGGELESLQEEIRQIRRELDLLRNQNSAIVNDLIFAPDTSQGDYAEARRGFKTTLVRKGPSPQGAPPVKPPAGVSEVEYVSGELRLKAWLSHRSDETRKHPAVLYLHGGFAFGMGDWEQTKPYRDAGFVVLAPILRAENGQPGAFTYFYDEVDDVVAAAEYLRALPYVDQDRLFVAGHSVGGTMTLLAAMTSHHFRAGASFDGAPYWGPFTEAKDLPFDKSDPREIQLRSPIAHAGSFKCPLRVYLHRADRDALGDFFTLMTQRMVARAKSRGLDVEAVAIEGDHVSHVPAAIRQSIAFFQRISGQETVDFPGPISPLPKSIELDLGDGVRLKLARVEPGTFQMGSPKSEAGRADDERLHEVEITKPYLLGIHPVTQAQYRQVMGASPSQYARTGNDRLRVAALNTDAFPVENVSWEDATDFCRVVSLRPEIKDRGWFADLPTEAEWEYACRAGTSTAFHFGNALSSQQANINGDTPYGGAPKGPTLGRPATVGSYPPNAWGFFDMHGSILQFCKDAYDPDYHDVKKRDRSDRVARGGFFFHPAAECRSAHRFHFPPDLRNTATTVAPPIGFRVGVRQREK